jgi:hypothetical protein
MVGRIVVGEATGPGAEPFDYFKDMPQGANWLPVPMPAQRNFPSIASILSEKVVHPAVPSRSVLEFVWCSLRWDEHIGSGSEVNWLVSEVLVEGLPAVDFSHGDLTSGEQRPEQHRGSFG